LDHKVKDKLVSEEDRKAMEEVYEAFQEAKEKKPIDIWQKYDQYIEDDQWDTAQPKDEWKPRPQLNICWSMLRTIHANMTSGKTSISITCKKPLYDDYAQKLNDVINSYWDELDMDLEVSEAEWIRPKLGSVAIKCVWNPSKNDGRGDLDVEVVHPANVFIDSNVTNPRKLQKGEYVDFVKPVSMRHILKKYSKDNDKTGMCIYTKDELKDILEPESDMSDTEIYGDILTGNSGNMSTGMQKAVGTAKTQDFSYRDTVKLHEYYYKDDNGKLQVRWVAGKALLKDSAKDEESKTNGFYAHGLFPLVYIPFIFRDKRLDGRSCLQSHVGKSKKDGIQDIINKLTQDYLVNEKLNGQGQIAVRNGAVKDSSKITGEAGLIITTKGIPSQDIMRIPGLNQNDLIPAVEAFLTHGDRISGQWDITQGRNTPSIKTLGQTSLLMEQAQKPQNDNINTLNYGLRELVEIMIAHISEFVTEDREYTKPSSDGGVESFTFNPSSITKAPTRTIQGEQVTEGKEESRLYFKTSVDVGAALAMTKAYQMEIAFSLWQQKTIDIQGFYKLLPEFPGKQESLDRMMQQQQQAEQMQQQQQGDQLIAQFVQSLPPEAQQVLSQMPPEQQSQMIQSMMQMQPEQLQQVVQDMINQVTPSQDEIIQNMWANMTDKEREDFQSMSPHDKELRIKEEMSR